MTKQYIGNKVVMAWASDKDGAPGYSVKYEDGYISWSPKDTFEKAYRAIEGDGQALTFGDALQMLKTGKCLARSSWSERSYIFLQQGSHDFSGHPEVVPGDIAGVDIAMFDGGGRDTITRMPSVCMRTAGGRIVVGWIAGQTDMLANDWQVVGG